MCEIGTIYLLPKALKSCPKSNKLPNLVTLLMRAIIGQDIHPNLQSRGLGFDYQAHRICFLRIQLILQFVSFVIALKLLKNI